MGNTGTITWILALLLVVGNSIEGLEIRVKNSGKTVPARNFTIQASISDILKIDTVKVELNGVPIQELAVDKGNELSLHVPVELKLGVNLISIWAETAQTSTSALATITYNGEDDIHPPTIKVVLPDSSMETLDSTIVIRGYVFDDVKVQQVTVEGQQTHPWLENPYPIKTRGFTKKSKNTISNTIQYGKSSYAFRDTLTFVSPTIPLMLGRNTLLIEAQDVKGSFVKERVQVFRRPSMTGERWAVVVGVAEYQHDVPELVYTDDDARALYQFLISPKGGAFDPQKTKLLIDKEATTQDLRDALFYFLRQAKQEDFVIIYFAGHGVADPYDPNLVYLMSYDSDPDRLASTALDMDDVVKALKRHIFAKHILFIADACHSGAIMSVAANKRSAEEGNELVYRYLQTLSNTKAGIGTFTATMTTQKAQEAALWGGRTWSIHLLFTGRNGRKGRL